MNEKTWALPSGLRGHWRGRHRHTEGVLGYCDVNAAMGAWSETPSLPDRGGKRGDSTEEQGHGGTSGPLLQACPVLTADSQDSGHSGGTDRPGSVD